MKEGEYKVVLNEGDKYGRLTVIKEVDAVYRSGRNHRMIYCLCECGTYKNISFSSLRQGGTNSCGCLGEETRLVQAKKNKKHGQRELKIYRTWTNMKQRCNNPNHISYIRYGAIGIKVCERWNEFINFEEDMGEQPEGLTLERIDSKGDYTPDNCRWATMHEQANNRSNNTILTYKGTSHTLSEWSKILNINARTLGSRLHTGWTIEEAFETPVRWY